MVCYLIIYQHHTRLANVKCRTPTVTLQLFHDPGRRQMQEALENGIGNKFQKLLTQPEQTVFFETRCFYRAYNKFIQEVGPRDGVVYIYKYY